MRWGISIVLIILLSVVCVYLFSVPVFAARESGSESGCVNNFWMQDGLKYVKIGDS